MCHRFWRKQPSSVLLIRNLKRLDLPPSVWNNPQWRLVGGPSMFWLRQINKPYCKLRWAWPIADCSFMSIEWQQWWNSWLLYMWYRHKSCCGSTVNSPVFCFAFASKIKSVKQGQIGMMIARTNRNRVLQWNKEKEN